jgi:hypothetical protein
MRDRASLGKQRAEAQPLEQCSRRASVAADSQLAGRLDVLECCAGIEETGQRDGVGFDGCSDRWISPGDR